MTYLILEELSISILYYELTYTCGILCVGRKVEVICVDAITQGRTCKIKGRWDETKTAFEIVSRMLVYAPTAIVKIQETLISLAFPQITVRDISHTSGKSQVDIL